MAFGDKLVHFIAFVFLTIITGGLYLIWFTATRVEEHRQRMEEQSALLREIRDERRSAVGD